ncbi:SNF2 family N-terminal domain-containing protein [Hysterangium stoloniferum]|nr:SNF2 family N-terminal domain-containing protein [Hysterangium stoloniferum]
MEIDLEAGVATKDTSSKRLFFASSDDEDDAEPINIQEILNRRVAEARSSSSVRDRPAPRESSVTSIQSSSPPPPKKRKITPPDVKVKANVEKSQKKPVNEPIKQTSSMIQVAGFDYKYVGSFLVPNAWSTCKGRGWVKPGESIHIRRNEEEPASSSASSKPPAGSSAKKGAAASGKQMKLTTMFKAQPKSAAPPKAFKRVKEDNVVRFTNARGFEIGRLPQNVASWVAKLLDQGMITFKNSTMVDCAESLQTGGEMLIQLRVCLSAEAFRQHRPSASSTSDEPRSMFNEGQETLDEQTLRERKSSLLELFKAVDLKPVRRNAFLRDAGSTVDVLDRLEQNNQADKVNKGKAKAVVGDDDVEDEDDAELLTDGQLDMIYKKAQRNDNMMPEMEPADTFTFTLRSYQKQALLWMHSLESGTAAARNADSIHPLWEEYLFPYEEQEDGIIDMTEEQKPFYFNPYSGELSVTFPRAERKCRGGVLAYSLGMGKTIMISSLLHTSRDPEPVKPPGTKLEEEASSSTIKHRQLKLDSTFRPITDTKMPIPYPPSTTLIIAPTSLMSQWAKELDRSSRKGSLKVLVWHGNNRDDLDDLLEGNSKVDVVITSYGIVGSEWTKHDASSRQGSPLFQVEWLRVVLDEAHNCKSRLSRTAKACFALRARRRWALTGTPIVNKLEDLYSLLKFLDFAPWSDYSFFRSFITLPFLNRDPKAVEIVQVILESVLLRREKNMRDNDGKQILYLLNVRKVTIERLDFSPLERKIYDSMYIDAKKNFERLKAKGLVGRNYTHILAMLMRLRRAVLHPSLVQAKETAEVSKSDSSNGQVDIDALIAKFTEGDGERDTLPNTFAEGVLKGLDEAAGEECAVCLDLMDMPVLVPGCMHSCCKSCVLAFIASCEEKGEEGQCPICRHGPVKESDLLEVVRRKPTKRHDSLQPDDLNDDRDSSPAVMLRRNTFNSSTKLNALSENLRRLRDQDPCFRAVVFSQFTSFLDLIEVVLRRDNFAFYRFDGEMSVKNKAAAVEEFIKPSRSGKVFIVSLKAGGVGLNLTAADHVYMMDCWWNAAIENQAIDRVHRIGQERTVYVKQFIISHTIEDRILQIQKRKTAIIKGALGGKSGEDADSMENLKIMFGEDI